MKTIQYLAATIAIPLACFFFAEQAQAKRRNTGVEVEIVSDQRGELKKFKAGSNKKRIKRNYVIARDHEEYRIRLRNRTSERIGVVVAVDGRNIISGRKSHLKPKENMYILNPYQTAEYSGWRSSRNHVNRFFFTNMNNSYAAAWGDSSRAGIIAVAAFKERYQQIHQYKNNDRSSGTTRNRKNSRNQRMSDRPGTGYGESEWSPSKKVSFSPRKKPMLKEFIKYEYRSTLCRRGVIGCQPHHPAIDHGPGFDQFGGTIFAPPPPGRHWQNPHHERGERDHRHVDGRGAHRVPVRHKEHFKGKNRDMAFMHGREMAELNHKWGQH